MGFPFHIVLFTAYLKLPHLVEISLVKGSHTYLQNNRQKEIRKPERKTITSHYEGKHVKRMSVNKKLMKFLGKESPQQWK